MGNHLTEKYFRSGAEVRKCLRKNIFVVEMEMEKWLKVREIFFRKHFSTLALLRKWFFVRRFSLPYLLQISFSITKFLLTYFCTSTAIIKTPKQQSLKHLNINSLTSKCCRTTFSSTIDVRHRCRHWKTQLQQFHLFNVWQKQL